MLKITKDNVPSLREKSKEVPLPLSEEDKALIDEMMDYLLSTQDPAFRELHPEAREGVGLAAPQVGHNVRMLVISYASPTKEDPEHVTQYKLVNPKIIVNSIKKVALENGEGCLSVDGDHPGLVHRDFKIVVEAFDAIPMEKVHITARGYDAIVLQHEIDHLNGVLFYDRINPKAPFEKLPDAVYI